MIIRKNFSSKVVAVSTSATELLAFDSDRSALMLHNQGSVDVQVYFGTASTAYIVLGAGETIHFPAVPLNQINAVATSGSVNVTVMHG